MSKRCSLRQLCLTVLLSQALAFQALVFAWSGAQATAAIAPAGPLAVLCNAALSNNNIGETVPGPMVPGTHHDCLSVCAAGAVGIEPPDRALPLARSASSDSVLIERDVGLLAISHRQVFLARAPPKLV